MTDSPHGPGVGSAADEAARLFAAVEEWARSRQGPRDGEPVPDGTPCAVCPVCSGIALLREVKPETVEHLLDAAASLVAALRSAVASAPGPPPADRSPGVERIDVRDG